MDLSEYRLLTIIVPTFERCDVLKDSLSRNVPYALPFKDKVRFFITDNASQDDTEGVVMSMKKQYPDMIYYHKQDRNYGADGNFKYGVANVNSKYVCLLGDEEVFSPYFFSYILGVIDRYPDVGEIHYNFLIGSMDFMVWHIFNNNMTNEMEHYYTVGKQFVYDMLNSPSLMSSNVFRRDLWIDSLKEEFDTPGYSWFSILCRAAMKAPCFYASFPLIYQRFSGQHDYSEKMAWYMIYGMGHLMQALDKDIPGIFRHWQEKFQIEEKVHLVDFLFSMSHFKDFYKERYPKYIEPLLLDPKMHLLGRLSLKYSEKTLRRMLGWYYRFRSLRR